jgi:hypothetical protein
MRGLQWKDCLELNYLWPQHHAYTGHCKEYKDQPFSVIPVLGTLFANLLACDGRWIEHH